MRTLSKIFILLFLYSCKISTNSNPDIVLDSNSDTVKVIKRYSSDSIREIITYENNRPKSNIGFSELGDTIAYPKCTYVKTSDSLFVFIPINKFQNIDLYFRFDSASGLTGKQPALIINNLKKSTMIAIRDEMYKETDMIGGAVKCWDSINTTYNYYLFETRTK